MTPTGSGRPSTVRFRVCDSEPPTLRYMKSTRPPQRPLRASKKPMNVNLRLSMRVLELTSMLPPVLPAGNDVDPPISGK